MVSDTNSIKPPLLCIMVHTTTMSPQEIQIVELLKDIKMAFKHIKYLHSLKIRKK